MLNLLIFTMLIILPKSLEAAKQCPKCGTRPVPYPLSTGPDCGDPDYKIRCTGGTLWFDALSGSKNIIVSINPATQTLILRLQGFDDSGTCVAADYKSQGIQLDPELPFNVTASNTLVLMNCSQSSLDLYTSAGFDCSNASLCHRYVRDNAVARARCGMTPFCCKFKTGGSVNSYKVYRARKERCSAYVGFVNLNADLPVRRWPEPTVEIEWALPREPRCGGVVDCEGLAKSKCLADPRDGGKRRCLCKRGFQWDPLTAQCRDVKCPRAEDCKLRKKSKTPIIAGTVGGAIAILGVSAALIFVCRKHNRVSNKTSSSLIKLRREILKANCGGLDKIFSSRDIIKATDDFSKRNLLGTGGFGEVFKGFLDNGTAIAVKRAKIGNEKSVDQIVNEVRILCKVKHENLVKLLGCCVELDMPMLIYEFIPNGTLFEHLHGTFTSYTSPLTWQRRLRIAHQTALALSYLHSSARPPIYHRDIKSSNILLDENLDARVSDFGLSRLGITDVSHVTTCAQGTLGYLDPEYYLNFQLTDKSDVYSFGVVLLELLTAKKAIDFNREEEDVNLVVLVTKLLREEKVMNVIDPAIKEGASKADVDSMTAIGFLAAHCLSERRQNRPSMKAVANEIESIMGRNSPSPEKEICKHLGGNEG